MSIYRHGGIFIASRNLHTYFSSRFFGTCSNQCLNIPTCAISQNITQCCLTTKVIGGEHHQNLTSQQQKPTSRWFKPWPFEPRSLEVTIHHLKGHVFTITKRSPVELPGILVDFLALKPGTLQGMITYPLPGTALFWSFDDDFPNLNRSVGYGRTVPSEPLYGGSWRLDGRTSPTFVPLRYDHEETVATKSFAQKCSWRMFFFEKRGWFLMPTFMIFWVFRKWVQR